MTNAEKYKDELTKAAFAVVKGVPTDCLGTSCKDCLFSCDTTRLKWLKEEYVAPFVDWATVKVDTPILVSDNNADWYRRHFARYEKGTVYTWSYSSTSWSANNYNEVVSWKYAKLAENK